MVAVRRASIPSEQLDCRGCSAARLARSTRASGTSRRGSTRIPPSTSRRSTRSGRPTTAVPRPRDRQPLDHAVRTAVPAYRVHVGGLPPRWPLGQVLAVLAAQVPLPPQRRGVQVLLQVPVQRCCKGPRPAMWVAFCKLRRCLKPARKDRRARLARIQLELHLACTSGRGSGPAACTHTARTRPVCALLHCSQGGSARPPAVCVLPAQCDRARTGRPLWTLVKWSVINSFRFLTKLAYKASAERPQRASRHARLSVVPLRA